MISKFYDVTHLKGNLIGGLVAGVVALPLVLAFGVQSGLGATAGLYGAIAVVIFAAIVGGVATQASGPTGPMTFVSAALVIAAIEISGSLESAMGIVVLIFLLGGLLQMLFGLINIARYVKYFPYPVLLGFMGGVGLIIIILQLFPFDGLSSAKSTWLVMQDLLRLFTDFNWQALALGALTVIIYYLFPRITKVIPSALVALLAASIVSFFLLWGVHIIGDKPSGLPSLQIESLFSIDPSAYFLVAEYAVVLAVFGAIDALLTSVIAVMYLHAKGVAVILTAVQEQPKNKLISIDIVPDLIPKEHFFDTINDGFDYLEFKFNL
jgi:SulP family sulfate permease